MMRIAAIVLVSPAQLRMLQLLLFIASQALQRRLRGVSPTAPRLVRLAVAAPRSLFSSCRFVALCLKLIIMRMATLVCPAWRLFAALLRHTRMRHAHLLVLPGSFAVI